MDQCRDRGGASHRVREPDVKRDLRRFTGHAHQHKKTDGRNNSWGYRIRRCEELVKLEAAHGPEHQEGSNQKTEVTNAVDDEGLFSSIRVGPGWTRQRVHLEPEADQEE